MNEGREDNNFSSLSHKLDLIETLREFLTCERKPISWNSKYFKEEMVNYRTYEKKSCMHWNLVNKRTHYLLGNILQSILTINPCNIYKPKWNCNNQGISNGLGSYNNLICLLNTRRTWLKKWLVISSFSTWNYWCLLLWNWRQLLITRCKPFSWG